MGEASGDERARRVIAPLIALVAVLVALGLGVAWTAAATGDRPGSEIDVAPVIDSGQLVTPTPTPTPTPAPAPPPEEPPAEVPAPQPVPAPPPEDVDDGDDGDD
jgi:outer membrane biosynthesis protein TonB